MRIKTDYLNVLVVSGGSYQGLALVKQLRASDNIRIVMADNSAESVSKYFVDKFYTVPAVKDRGRFINSLMKICRSEKIDIIFHSTDFEMKVLAEQARVFEKRKIRVAVSSPDFINLISDKKKLYEFLKNGKFPILPCQDIASEALEFPLLGKPLSSWGSKGLILLNSFSERDKFGIPKLRNDYIWQPYLRDAEEYSIDCGINLSGAISRLLIRRRVKVIGGFSAICDKEEKRRLEAMAKKLLLLMSRKGARGLINIQVLYERKNYYFSDVNLRIGTSSVYSLPDFLNPALFICKQIYPEIKCDHPSLNTSSGGLRMVRYLQELWIDKPDLVGLSGFVFDLDDTLINQKTWIFEKLQLLHREFKRELPSSERFLLKSMQILEEGNRSKLFDALALEFGFRTQFKDALISAYRSAVPEKAPVFPEVLPILLQLKERGFKLALLTDNPVASQKQKVDLCGFKDIFDVIVYSRQLKQEKPASEAFSAVSRRLGAKPSSLAMVGDNLYRDIFGALNAGYKFAFWVAREGGFYNFDENISKKLFGSKSSKFRKLDSLREIPYYLDQEQR